MANSTELRVFISSTFRDLQDEREHLVKKIFPEIRDLCRKRGIVFTEVDLRWGIRHEESEYGTVIRACLDEIDRCRPYFIGITGERYGYVPTYTEIYKDPELLRRFPWIEDAVLDASSIVELEFRYGALDDPASNSHAKFFFGRQRRTLGDEAQSEDRRRLESLKDRVRQAGLAVEEFRDPVSLGEAVYDHLLDIIERDFAGARAPTALESERTRHQAFAASRRHAYIPNPRYLRALSSFVEGKLDEDGESQKLIVAPRDGGGETNALVVYAESGSGKSALLAYWGDQYRRRHPETLLVEHYVGVGASTTDHIAILRHIAMEIADRYQVDEEISTAADQLIESLPTWLGYTRGERVVLLIDGVNQLQGGALSMSWLPVHLPANVSLVVTTTVEQTLLTLRHRGWRQLGVQPLTVEEREAIVVRFLGEYHKSMPLELVREVAGDIKCAHPLFLRTLLEEIRMFGSHERLDREVRRYLLATGTEDLFQIVLERIEEDFGARMVRDALGLLWASRAGLAESELVEITGASRLKLTALIRGLDYHLVSGGELLSFFHDYLRRAVEKRYLADDERKREEHRRVGRYFAGLEPSTRVADELPWQLSQAEDWSALRDVLRDDRMLAILMSGERKHELLALWRQIGDRFDLAATYLECIERLRGDDHPTSRRRSAMRNAAHLLVMAEVWEPAEQLFRALLQDNTQEFGDDSVEVSDTLTDLGAMLGHITRYEEGEEMVLRAIAIRERHFGRESRQTSDSLRMLGWLFFEQRRYAEAEPIYRRRLEIDEAEYGSNDARICDDANNLACQLWNLGRFQEADALYQRALETGRSAFGPDHPKLAMVYNNHAVMLGRWAATESTERDPRVLEYLQRAIQINEKWYGLSHSETASAVSNLGSLLLEYGRFEEGLQLLKRAALRYDGATDIVTIRVGLLHGYLARAELGMGNVGLALKSQQLAHGLLLKVHGPLHEPTALSLGALSHLLCESGRGDEACGLVRDMLRDLEERENVDPALTWFHRVQLCYALRRSGHSGEAMDLIEAVVKQMGDTAAWRLRQRGFTEYAWVLLERGAVGQAVEAATAACAVENPGIGWRASLIRAHAELALASALLAAGDRGEAERRARVALPLFERFAGPQHPDTRAARTLLARLAPDDSGPGDTETQHADSNQVRSRM